MTLAALALLCTTVFAQKAGDAPVQISQNKAHYTSFMGVSIAKNFDASIVSGDSYTSVIEADSRIADFCRAYVMGSILYVDIDDKTLPADAKKILNKKGAQAPVLKVLITIPAGADFQQINVDGNASLACSAAFSSAAKLNVVAAGNAVISSMKATVSDLSVTASKKASVTAEMDCNNLKVVTSNNAQVTLKGKATAVAANTDDASQLSLEAVSNTLTLNHGGFTKSVISGTAEKMDLIARINAKVDASKATVKKVWADLNHAEATVNATQNIKMTLQSGAKLSYSGHPVIEIDKIQSSTVIPLTPASKK